MTEISTIRMPADFEREFPGASRSASEVAVNLARAQLALVTEIERPAREAHGLSASAFQALAILDGAGEPLPPPPPPRGAGGAAPGARHRRATARQQRQHDLPGRHPRTPRSGRTSPA